MSKYFYENYIGDDGFLFLACEDADKAGFIPLVNYIAEQGVKVFFDIVGDADAVTPQKAAQAIDRSAAAVFMISDKACGSLEFRNSINYAADIKKRIIWISDEHGKPSQGLEMQLANAESIRYEGSQIEPEKMMGMMIEKEIITQDVLGGDPKVKSPGRKKKRLLILLIIVALLAFGYLAWNAAVDRVRYYKSAEWILRDSDGKDYVSLQGAGEDGIRALEGMTIKELDMRKGDITDMSGIENIHVKLLDLGDCSGIKNMNAIAKSEDLVRVRIPQDMVQYIEGCIPSDIEFELTESVKTDGGQQ